MSDHETMRHVLDRARGALRSESLRLRELRPADLPRLVAWWRDPEVARFNDHLQPRPDASVEEMFRTWSSNDSSAGAAFCVETVDGELVGHVALWGAEVRNRCATFAIVIGPEHQSRGGVLRSKLFYDGRFHDQVVMAALSPLD